MKIIRSLAELKPQNSVVTIGTYDGIHRGHQELLERLVASATEKKCRSVVITFFPHPQVVLRPDRKPELLLLTAPDEKIDRLAAYGVDVLMILEFTPEFSKKSSEEFVREILMERAGVKKVIIGYDHAFGNKREGNLHTLQRMSRELGFEVESVEPCKVNEIVVSSTLIRKLLIEGYLEQANELLGYAYSLKGKVVPGDGRGKTIGFPTANLEIDARKAIPKNGVYHCTTTIGERVLDAAVNIGVRPTFDHSDRTVEAHLIDFNEDIYGSELELVFKSRIREERKFDSVESLTDQIKKDISSIA